MTTQHTAAGWFWTIHLTPLAPRCNCAPDHTARNLMRRYSLLGGTQALLTRCAVAPTEVDWIQGSNADPELRQISTGHPLAYVWTGPPIEALRSALKSLRQNNWLPATYVAPKQTTSQERAA